VSRLDVGITGVGVHVPRYRLSSDPRRRLGRGRKRDARRRQLRRGQPDGDLEAAWGDAAAAVRLGQGERVVARLVGAASHTHEFSDVWRLAETRFPEQGDPTFVRAYGYERLMAEATRRLLAETGLAPAAIHRAAVYAPDARLALPILRSLGLGEGVLPRVPLLAQVGNVGPHRAAPRARRMPRGFGAG
jgi:3-hydroxy-3-methylglutaryl CoA synthase